MYESLSERAKAKTEFAETVSHMASELCWVSRAMQSNVAAFEKVSKSEFESVEQQAIVDALSSIIETLFGRWSSIEDTFAFYIRGCDNGHSDDHRRKVVKVFDEDAESLKTLSEKFNRYMRLLDGVEK